MTKAERLLILLTEVDDVLVEEAAQPFFPVPAKKSWGKWAALAACLLLVVGLVRVFPFGGMGSSTSDGAPMAPSASMPQESSAPAESCEPSEAPLGNGSAASGENIDGGETPPEASESVGLPVLQLSSAEALSGGSWQVWTDDLDGYLSDAVSPELVSDTMPVYATIHKTDAAGCPTEEADLVSMNALLDELLSRFGWTQENCATKESTTPLGNLTEEDLAKGGPTETTWSLTATAEDGTKVTVNWDLTASIQLPGRYWSNLVQKGLCTFGSTPDEAEAAAQLVVDEFGWLLDIETPVIRVTGGETNRYGDVNYSPVIYDGSDDPLYLTQTKVTFNVHTDFDTLFLRFDTRSEPTLMGHYPIISAEEAQAELMSGEWVDWAKGYTPPIAEEFLRSELTYRTLQNGLLMPYYRFYLDRGETIGLAALNEDGTTTPTGEELPALLCLYVPAVQREYLDLSFMAG